MQGQRKMMLILSKSKMWKVSFVIVCAIGNYVHMHKYTRKPLKIYLYACARLRGKIYSSIQIIAPLLLFILLVFIRSWTLTQVVRLCTHLPIYLPFIYSQMHQLIHTTCFTTNKMNFTIIKRKFLENCFWRCWNHAWLALTSFHAFFALVLFRHSPFSLLSPSRMCITSSFAFYFVIKSSIKCIYVEKRRKHLRSLRSLTTLLVDDISAKCIYNYLSVHLSED